MNNLKDLLVTKDDKVNVNYYSEFMEDYAEEQLFTQQSELQTIRLSNGESGIFALGQNNNLYLIRRTDNSPGGWSKHVLNTSVDKKDTIGAVTAFGVTIDEEGNTAIGIGTTNGSNSAPTFHVATGINFATLEFSKFQPTEFYQKQALNLNNGVLNHISLKSNNGLLAYQPHDNPSDATLFKVDLSSLSMQQVVLPTNSSDILQASIGQVKGNIGYFALFKYGFCTRFCLKCSLKLEKIVNLIYHRVI